MQMLKAYAKDFWRYRYLLQNLIGRDFKLKYRRSVLGVVWSVLNPLLMNVVMVVVDVYKRQAQHALDLVDGVARFVVDIIAVEP